MNVSEIIDIFSDHENGIHNVRETFMYVPVTFSHKRVYMSLNNVIWRCITPLINIVKDSNR